MKHAVLSNLNGIKNKLVKVKLISEKWNVVCKSQNNTWQP
jgi:hypothetical protein